MKREEEVKRMIEELELEPHPEGGYYKEIYRSTENILRFDSREEADPRSCGTSIYFLMVSGKYSSWHKIDSDEQWCHHEGAPVTLHTLDDRTGELSTYKLGSIKEGGRPQLTVPKGLWFCAQVDHEDSYSLVGCQVFPAFEFSGFTLGNKGFWYKYNSHRDAGLIRDFLHPDVKNELLAEEAVQQAAVIQHDPELDPRLTK